MSTKILPGAVALVAALHVLSPRPAAAQAVEVRHSEYEMQDVNHAGEKALTLDGLLVNDAWANVRGGNYRGVGVVGNLILMGAADTEKLGWWQDGRFALDGIAVYGRRPSLAVGDYQFTSSIDSFDTIELYQAYYQQYFEHRESSLLIGIHDFTTEFAVLNYGFVFVNSSFFTPATITQLPYSFYPFTGLGIRYHRHFSDEYMIRAGVYDGKPASLRHGRGMDYGINADDGAYAIVETGYEPEETTDEYHGKYVIGAWENSGTYTDFEGDTKVSNTGAYILGEQELWREEGSETEGLGTFAQVAWAKPDRNFNSWYFGAGFRYQGLFENREEDILALGFAMAETGSVLRTNNPGYEGNERVLELSYRAIVTPSFALTPDIQWVANPGAKSALHDSLILYIRSELKM